MGRWNVARWRCDFCGVLQEDVCAGDVWLSIPVGWSSKTGEDCCGECAVALDQFKMERTLQRVARDGGQ